MALLWLRVFDEFPCAAASWSRSRRAIVKAEHSSRGANPRHVVTSLLNNWCVVQMPDARIRSIQ